MSDAAALAGLVASLFDRTDQLRSLREELAVLQRGGVAMVLGELRLVEGLEHDLAEAHDALARLATGADLAATVGALQPLLDSALWQVADGLPAELVQRKDLQADAAEQVRAAAAKWRTDVRELQRSVAGARTAGAVFGREEKLIEQQVAQLAARLDAVDAALAQGLVAAAAQELAIVQRKPTAEADPATVVRPIEELRTAIALATTSAWERSRLAEVLVLQGPLDGEAYKYNIVLRTPSLPGAHGVNVQVETPVWGQDRKRATDQLDILTHSIRVAREAPSEVAATPVASDAAAPGGMPALLETLRDTGDLIYRVFLPEAVQRMMTEGAFPVTVATNDLEIPWELLHDGNDFICLQRPFARMPLGRAVPRRMIGRAPPRRSRFLLIHADPIGNLPGARQEVLTIEQRLREELADGIEVEVWKDGEATGDRLNDALRHASFDVIHYAGHAKFDVEEPEMSGLYLPGEEVFFSHKIRRFVEGSPLVFLNACESARNSNEVTDRAGYLDDPAEGVASSFIYGGALGCIGALWPIFDTAAADFAVEFYLKVLENNTIGEAMRLARLKSRTDHPDDPTWASFVLFGDPTYRLNQAAGRSA